jgi:hypothetical protein
MRNLNFGFFDDSGMPRESRILIFYSFETDDRLQRSGILHYHIGEGRFVGPRHDQELTSAALSFIEGAGRLPKSASAHPPLGS